MLIWVNGPFGGGKTQTAYELNRRLPGSVVCDPEEVGFGLHRAMPPSLRGDFQDLRAWRAGVVEVLVLVLAREPVVIAPMTLVEPAYFDEVVGGLRSQGHDVRHVALMARRETVVRRLRERRAGHLVRALAGRGAWRAQTFAAARLNDCLARLARPELAEHVWTDDLTVAQVADRVAAYAGLTLAPATDGPLRAWGRRAVTGLRHVRLG